jgi:preprotein translocase subunit SecG
MKEVLLIIQLLVAAGLIAVILMQRSEGGALGIGGGGGGMMSSRGAANVLTRTTMILGAIFIANCILLAVVASVDSEGRSVFDRDVETPVIDLLEEPEQGAPVPTDG